MKKQIASSGDRKYTRPGSNRRGIIALMLIALAPVALGIAQKIPTNLGVTKDAGTAYQSPANDAKKLGIAKPGSASAVLSAISTAEENGKVVVSVSAKGHVEYKAFTLSQPRRLVVDFINADITVPYRELPVNLSGVKQIRISRTREADTNITRLVFDLADVKKVNHEIVSDDQGVRILFPANPDLASAPKTPPSATAAKSAPKPEPQPAKSAPAPATKASVSPASKPASAPKAAPTKAVKSVSATPSKPAVAPTPEPPASKPASAVKQDAPPPMQTLMQSAAIAPIRPTNSSPAVPAQAPTVPQTTGAAAKAPEPEGRFGGSPLTLDLVDIPLVDFFRLMAEEGGINVVMDPEIRGTISIKVVKVPWDQILEAALTNNSLDKQIEGNLVRIAKKSTLQSEAKQREDLKKANVLAADVETRVKRLNYAKAGTFVPQLTEQKSVRGTVVVDERSNSLVLTDIPSFIDKMSKLIDSLDMPQPQVEIEARIVSANRDFARDLGVQFGFVQGNLQRNTVGGPNTFGTIGGTRPAQTPASAYVAGNPMTGRGASESKAAQSAGVSTGTGSQNLGNFNVNLPAGKAFGGIGLSMGNILDTFLLDAAITAGESKGLAKLISQPKVTAQNNSPATITQGLRFPVQIVANNTVTVQFQNAALTLNVTPQITVEGNVVLDLQVENNTPDFSRQVNGVPSIRTSESKTRVLVNDGGTTVIGGIIIESDSNTSDKVPGLGSLPGVGNLFKRTSVSKTTQEVLFFITPKVIKF